MTLSGAILFRERQRGDGPTTHDLPSLEQPLKPLGTVIDPLRKILATGWDGEGGAWKMHFAFCFVRSLHQVCSDADPLMCRLAGNAEALASYVEYCHILALGRNTLASLQGS